MSRCPHCNVLLKQLRVEHGCLLLVSKPITRSVTQVSLGRDKLVANLDRSERVTAGDLCWPRACELGAQLLQHRHTHSFVLLLVDDFFWGRTFFDIFIGGGSFFFFPGCV